MKGNVSKAKGGGGGGVTVADGKVYVKDGSRNIELVQAYQTYGVSIDLSNSNPETAVTYTDDAVGMVAGSPDWYKMSIFNKIKPCLFKNGAVVGYLNPDNFAQYADGSAADISSGDRDFPIRHTQEPRTATEKSCISVLSWVATRVTSSVLFRV